MTVDRPFASLRACPECNEGVTGIRCHSERSEESFADLCLVQVPTERSPAFHHAPVE